MAWKGCTEGSTLSVAICPSRVSHARSNSKNKNKKQGTRADPAQSEREREREEHEHIQMEWNYGRDRAGPQEAPALLVSKQISPRTLGKVP